MKHLYTKHWYSANMIVIGNIIFSFIPVILKTGHRTQASWGVGAENKLPTAEK